ncbi:SRPBCC family protein [Streptomyces sp. RB6PN25]|uniref:SRPBCC family protein n=1 Tax=Streptomyces humicola TaxID=2953240 RepID=A0ABT1PPH0_9ACTN|nr:SRPBCC family protein [Streptomyces humicola]MCQ4079572.1 SRPBCC family protein [Streptomyces humicola]
MSSIVCTIEIARPPGEVFAYATDPSRFAEWQRDVVSVRNAGDGPNGAYGKGSRFTTVRRIGGSERTMTQEITEVTPSRSWAAHGVDGPIRPNAGVSVEPVDDGAGSRATFTFDFEGEGIGVLLLPLVRKMTAKGAPASLRNLKALLESGD